MMTKNFVRTLRIRALLLPEICSCDLVTLVMKMSLRLGSIISNLPTVAPDSTNRFKICLRIRSYG
jgi:hypothetical protein